MKTSIEVEYWVVDSDGTLSEPGPLADGSDHAATGQAFVEPLVELETPPCETISELRTALVSELETVLSRAAALDKRLVPLGTPINGDATGRRSGERDRIRRAVIGEGVDDTAGCAGTRIRLEKRTVADQLNGLIALDPALALVNSSPYYQGERIANGARGHRYRTRREEDYPAAGRHPRYVETVDEWHRRLERRYETFVDAAVEAGFDPGTIETHVSSDDVGWTPVRLRDSTPGVEWRSPDSALPSQLLRLADELETVMERLHRTPVRIDAERDAEYGTTAPDITADDGGPTARPGHVTTEEISLPAAETVRDLTEAAIRDGLASGAVADYLERMGFTVADYHPIAMRIDGRQYVTTADARDMRLEYASRLDEDLEALRRTVG